MASYKQEIRAGIIIESQGALNNLKKIETKLKSLNKQLSLSSKFSGLGLTEISKMSLGDKKISQIAKELALRKEQLKLQKQEILNNKKLTTSYMGLGFAMLFGGMALKRVFNRALQSIFKSYADIMDEHSEFTQLTNRLTGAWEFFKFTLVDALMQTGLFQAVIGFVIKLVNWIGQFTAKHPKIAAMVTIFLGLGAAIAAATQWLGQLLLLYISLKNIELTKSIVALEGKLGNVITKSKTLKEKLSSLNFLKLDKLKNAFSNLYNTVKVLINKGLSMLINNIKWIKNNPIKAIMAIGVLTAIIYAVYWLYKMQKAMGGVKEFWHNVVRGFMRGLAYIGAGVGALINYIRTKGAVSFGTLFKEQLDVNLKKLTADFGVPKKGWAEFSFKDFVSGSVYGDNETISELNSYIEKQLYIQEEQLNEQRATRELMQSRALSSYEEITYAPYSSAMR